ncbi:phosphoadenylyl-sulfate reductase [Tepidimonas charontis]|uniref:Adenosine 5'-phosphosulfate reductase n=1 Tax=Tepidimonas charontis TaxID=2267262 RepID=A0A554XDS8_9BURK|nr:phosphoadenylyl-sulfate reductase [Tepidimonas charontis]TSE33914.1 Thioredoxin-dependent 5'-adenylylsulfate reductase [Tepidimonas charontis]
MPETALTTSTVTWAPAPPPTPQPGRAFALYARHSPGYEARLASAQALLATAAHDFAGSIVQATSLGAEDMVITDLIVRAGLPIALATLDTGRLHPETVALMERLQIHWGVPLEIYRPDPQQVADFVHTQGEDAMYRSRALRQACCALRKLQPLAQMLRGRRAWITGLRREQSDTRAQVPLIDRDADGRVKFNPLAEWHWSDVWHYIATHDVPYNPLHDAFMPSIGCAPCTRAIAVGEDFRAGRWWWEDDAQRECGLHVRHGARPLAPNSEERTA